VQDPVPKARIECRLQGRKVHQPREVQESAVLVCDRYPSSLLARSKIANVMHDYAPAAHPVDGAYLYDVLIESVEAPQHSPRST
jgi:hypothetical protein